MKNDQLNLLAALAMYTELHNQEQYTNHYDIIAHLIKIAVASRKKLSVNCTELTKILAETFGLHLPECIVRETVKETMRDLVTLNGNGHYFFEKKIIPCAINYNVDHNRLLSFCDGTLARLQKYVRTRQSRQAEVPIDSVIEQLEAVLLEQGSTGPSTKAITDFIEDNKDRPDFTNNLSRLREGFIFHRALQFSPKNQELYTWKTPLTIFLSIEHLFNVLEANGPVFKGMSDDLNALVKEINQANKSRNRHSPQRIEYRYFEETGEELDRFFKDAESILLGHNRLDPMDPSRPAMEWILDGCENISDIQAKRVNFDLRLKDLGITAYRFDVPLLNYVEYRVYGPELCKQLEKDPQFGNEHLDLEFCKRQFTLFSRINFLREGKTGSSIGDVRCLLLTNRRALLYLTHKTNVRFEESDIPFAVDLDFLTNKLSQKLKMACKEPPISGIQIHHIARLQAALSSFPGSNLIDRYTRLCREWQAGKLSEREALGRFILLRDKKDTVRWHLDQSRHFNFENRYRERDKLESRLQEEESKRRQLEDELTLLRSVVAQNEYHLKLRNYVVWRAAEVDKKWRERQALNRKNIIYFLRIRVNIVLATTLSTSIKLNKGFTDWLANGGWAPISAILIIIGLIAKDTIDRAQLNKDNLRNGQKWFWAKLFKHQIYKTLKREEIRQLKLAFESENPPPTKAVL